METQMICNNIPRADIVELKFETDLLPLFNQRFDKAQKKYARVGQELRILSMRQGVEDHRDVCGVVFEEDVPYTYIAINRPSVNIRPGVTFWGTISLKDGTKTVYKTDAAPEDLVLSELELVCDHCNTKRRRNAYFIFEEDGHLMRLGSTCVQPYYGLDLVRILRVFSFIMADLEAPIEGGGGGRDIGWNLSELILATEFVTTATGCRWIKGETAATVRMLLIDCWKNPHKKEVEKFVEFCQGIDKSRGKDVTAILMDKYNSPTNDFEWNIFNNLYTTDDDGNRVLRHRVPSKASGLICFAIFQAIHGDYRRKDKSQEVESGEKEQSPTHIGVKGQRMTLRVKAIILRELTNQWGDSLMIGFEDESGNQLRWFYTGNSLTSMRQIIEAAVESGEFMSIKATIKSHGEYRGAAQTTLTRVAIQ